MTLEETIKHCEEEKQSLKRQYADCREQLELIKNAIDTCQDNIINKTKEFRINTLQSKIGKYYSLHHKGSLINQLIYIKDVISSDDDDTLSICCEHLEIVRSDSSTIDSILYEKNTDLLVTDKSGDYEGTVCIDDLKEISKGLFNYMVKSFVKI